METKDLSLELLQKGIGAGMEGDGGRYWDRTSDPYDVNVVLSR